MASLQKLTTETPKAQNYFTKYSLCVLCVSAVKYFV